MDTTEEHHSRLGKGDEEYSLGKVVASKNSQKLTKCGVNLSLIHKNFVVKLLRAVGGCLGIERRRRTC